MVGCSIPRKAEKKFSIAASARTSWTRFKSRLAYVDAQREYAMKDRDGDGLVEYAQKFRSDPGKKNGLYWEAKAGEEVSPLGPLRCAP